MNKDLKIAISWCEKCDFCKNSISWCFQNTHAKSLRSGDPCRAAT